MPVPTIDEVFLAYSQRTSGEIGRAEHELIQKYWLKDLIPLLVQTYPRLSRRDGRIAILFRVLRFARDRDDIVSIAIGALSDRAYLVREHACSILAYSLRTDAIPHLQALAARADEATAADAKAAIDAISSRNHHYYVDRTHSGNTRWLVRNDDFEGVA